MSATVEELAPPPPHYDEVAAPSRSAPLAPVWKLSFACLDIGSVRSVRAKDSNNDSE